MMTQPCTKYGSAEVWFERLPGDRVCESVDLRSLDLEGRLAYYNSRVRCMANNDGICWDCEASSWAYETYMNEKCTIIASKGWNHSESQCLACMYPATRTGIYIEVHMPRWTIKTKAILKRLCHLHRRCQYLSMLMHMCTFFYWQ